MRKIEEREKGKGEQGGGLARKIEENIIEKVIKQRQIIKRVKGRAWRCGGGSGGGI